LRRSPLIFMIFDESLKYYKDTGCQWLVGGMVINNLVWGCNQIHCSRALGTVEETTHRGFYFAAQSHAGNYEYTGYYHLLLHQNGMFSGEMSDPLVPQARSACPLMEPAWRLKVLRCRTPANISRSIACRKGQIASHHFFNDIYKKYAIPEAELMGVGRWAVIVATCWWRLLHDANIESVDQAYQFIQNMWALFLGCSSHFHCSVCFDLLLPPAMTGQCPNTYFNSIKILPSWTNGAFLVILFLDRISITFP